MGRIFFFVLLICSVFAGCDYGSKQQHQNRLHAVSSPYLQEHADNPVDWYEWGEEALAKAKQDNKPLLISIGYASCHWCHVMERESFMDTAVARLMNESFICIKVDREERPDINNIYMHALQLLNKGEAGWPLNAFALPDGKPFFAGTYYTTENWKTLLVQIADSYKNKNAKVVLQAQSLTFGIIDNDSLLFKQDLAKNDNSKEAYQALFQKLAPQIDVVNGGLRGTQKFPNPSLWEFLLQYHYLTGDEDALTATTNTLTKIALGGIYDHLGGGFARYSTDSLWRIPHFEKMLYDNAQLISLYANAYKITKNGYFKTIFTETIAFVERELTSPSGGFYSSLNAETDGDEGAFYAWEYDAFLKAAGTGANAKTIANYYQLQPQGNWDIKRNIMFATEAPAQFAKRSKIDSTSFLQLLHKTKKALFTERNKRKKPTVDTKILTSWNAIMLKAYIDAFSASGNENYLQKAIANATFLEATVLEKNGKVFRSNENGKSVQGFMDDYAWLACAYTKLYEVTFDIKWLTQSKLITDYAINHFYDSTTGMFFFTSNNATELVVRKTDIEDHVIPSSNAVMGEVLLKLATFYGDSSYLNKFSRMMGLISNKTNKQPAYYAHWCGLQGLMAHGTYEVAIMGTDAVLKNHTIQKQYLPTCIFMGDTKTENLPLLTDKLQANKTMIYVCTDGTCKLPAEEVEKALEQIKRK